MPSVLERLRKGLPPTFTVERELASGGMGMVFLGRDESLDRPVAIKILRPELSTAPAVERFVREAQYLASLNHPNIVPIHLAGRADGLAYYVMDFVDGETLDARLARGPLTLPEVLGLASGLLSALAAAHRKGIVHRDVKPANIFLVGGRAMLGDFGIARASDEASEALTTPGQVIGTLAYMAPEQLSGSAVTPQTDLYAVGLVLYQACTGRRWDLLVAPEDGNWAGVPSPLCEVLQTALEAVPKDRWNSAQSFARALTGRGTRLRLARLSSLPLAALALYGGYWLWPAPKPVATSVAVYPFEVAGLPDTTLGIQLARLTASYLEALPGVTVAPVRQTFRDWRASSLPPGKRLVALTQGQRGSEYGVWAVARPGQGGVQVQLQVVNAHGEPVLRAVVQGDATDRIGLGDSLALQIVRKVFPQSEELYRSAGAFAGLSTAAIHSFLFGEDASERGAWLTAERHYLNALATDSTFVLAAWRLANARRWMPLRSAPPLPAGFRDLYRANGSGLGPVDRLLIDAQFAPGGNERFALYEEAMRRAPLDAYPALYYGDELFHRGPLAGRPRDDAIRMLQHAVRLDSSLAPAHEHLAWALIHAGRRDEARLSLDALQRVSGSPEESEIFLPALLEIAFAMRFTPEARVRPEALLRSPSALALAARGALSFDMPMAQVRLGAQLAAVPAASAATHGSGEVAQGVALMALGRPADALAHFDAAAKLLPNRSEALLQALEWRVVLPAVGFPGIPPSEVDRGRRELRLLLDGKASGPRVAWVLALDALGRGDTSAANPWIQRVLSGSDSIGPLALHLRALHQSNAGRFQDAIDLVQPALKYDSAGAAADPFFRSVLHLHLGEWHASAGHTDAADSAWLWYENLDAVGWPSTVAQACEVDWALATYARWRRARMSASTGSRSAACRGMTYIATRWSGAESAYAPLLKEARKFLQRCPR